MAFATGNLDDHQKIGSGENYGQGIVLADATFENGLIAGRFAKADAGSIDNLDSSATPVIAGVVLRDPTMAVEDGEAYDSSLYTQVEYQREGLITVQAVTGQTPALFEAIYAENQTPADYGKATLTASGNADANAEFIKLVDGALDVWQIRLK
jgi:hypothetical protein